MPRKPSSKNKSRRQETRRVSGKKDDKNVSDTKPNLTSEENECESEIWDLVCAVPQSRANSTRKECMTDGCSRPAVATWASNLAPDKSWDTCDVCQERDFGGWPEDFDFDDTIEGKGETEEGEKAEEDPDEDTGKEDTGIGEAMPEKPSSQSPAKSGVEGEKGGKLQTRVNKEERTKSQRDSDDVSDSKPCSPASDLKSLKKLSEHNDEENDVRIEESNMIAAGANIDDEVKDKTQGEIISVKVARDQEDGADARSDDALKDEPSIPRSTGNPSSTQYVDKEEAGEGEAEDSSGDLPVKDEPKLDESGNFEAKCIAEEEDEIDHESVEEKEHAKESSDDEDQEELWDLKIIFSVGELTKSHPVMCSTDNCSLVACSAYVSNQNPSAPWYTCLDCQALDYGGWPPLDELPIKAMSEEHRRIIAEKCSRQESPEMPDLPTSKRASKTHRTTKGSSAKSNIKDHDELQNHADSTKERTITENDEIDRHEDTEAAKSAKEKGSDVNEYEDQEEKWDLKIIFSVADLTKSRPVMCSTEDCSLVACGAYVSTLNPADPWYTCLDCQELDYGGWPPSDELPIKAMSDEHRRVIAEKCSRQESPEMPDLPTSKKANSRTGTMAETPSEASNKDSARLQNSTPPPSSVVEGKQQDSTHRSWMTTVTPSPIPLKPAQPSASALAMHRKWQEAAEAMGGPDARIVVSKPAAKKLIFDMLYESFRPMNITEIYKTLKAVVPSPVLKSCLDDMSLDDANKGNPFDESDDENDDEVSSSKTKISRLSSSSDDQYAGSLQMKPGRNSSTILYFVDHRKLANDGNGLPPDEKNALAAVAEEAKAEEEALNQNLKKSIAEADKLSSEPTNEEANSSLESEEKLMEELNEKLEVARALKVNEKHRKQTKRRIEAMATEWRKRRRLCMDFLIMMEETTEGTVSARKCMSGDGPIEIDSDEAVAKGAIAWAKKKRSRVGTAVRGCGSLAKSPLRLGKSKSLKSSSHNDASGISPSESFVAVKLDSRGNVCRVYIDDEE